MKKTLPNKRGTQDGNQPPSQPEKSGWIRKYCGRGIFREIWKNRFVILKTDQLYISEKEVKDEKVVLDKFDLTDYEKCEELRKSKSRSKKSHSKFTLLRNKQPGNTASTSTSDGMLTLDLIQEEDPALDRRGTCADGFCSQHKPNYETSTKSCEKGNPVTEKDCSSRVGRLQKRGDSWQRESATSLDREGGSSPDIPKKLPFAELNKCASEEILSRAGTANRSALRKGFETQTSNIEQEKLGQVRELIALKLERTQQLLLEAGRGSWKRQDRDSPGVSEGQVTLNDTEWLLSEALSNWNQAKQVLQEVKELRHLCKQSARMHTGPALGSTSQPPYRGSLM
ncbi:pleckstrin homology domain-containing family O member 1-like isoform X2 [Hemiscyllium ocellatum]|uniref:pleckstrin homology domain-containing family O member 1-like isoform X2 n=1 Tax=Hemiscyllium ocellatum TaxID=170820 RepID=UPI0029674BB0|nr:pleckstrin homology domain-containing family O member 1-like isoform X2 [Hemiscyllium ocellatum]